MSLLDKARPIAEVEKSNLWVLYGKSASGKTTLASTFPKPMLYLQIGDDGVNSISDVDGISVIEIKDLDTLKNVMKELKTDTKYKTVLIDTFSLVVNEWIDANAIQKNKKMTMTMWGDILTDTSELIKTAHILAKQKIVVLTCHEVTDSFEGMEGEITPDVRPNVSKGARTYLEGMSNYGLHTTMVTKEKDGKDVKVYAIHLATNPYYWVKTQKPSSIKLPEMLINPTYEKIMKLLSGESTKNKEE